MTNEQPKAGRPGETSEKLLWEGPAETRASGSDERIAQAVEHQLSQDSSFNFDGLILKVDTGEVTLEGYVAQLSDRDRAGEIVLDIEGVTAFRNLLRIAPERH